MIKKNEKCLYCGEKMESKTAKKKFCSDLHRVYYNREKGRGTLDFKNVDDKLSEALKKYTSFGSVEEFNEVKEVVDNSTRISELEAELKTVPENTTLGKRRRAWLNQEIARLSK